MARPEPHGAIGARVQHVDLDPAVGGGAGRKLRGRGPRGPVTPSAGALAAPPSAPAPPVRAHAVDQHPGVDVPAHPVQEVTHDAAVALGPGQVLDVVGARAEVVPPRPRGGRLQRAAVVVAAAVVHVPAQVGRGPAGSVEVLAHRHPVERDHRGVGGAGGDGESERPAAPHVPAVPVTPNLGLERREFHRLGGAGGGIHHVARRQPFAPPAVHEQPLLGGVAQVARVVDRLSVRAGVQDQTHLGDQLPGRGCLGSGDRQVVRAPGKARDVVLAPPRVASRLRLELEHHEVAHAAARELPRRGQSRDARPHDDHGDVVDLPRLGPGAVPQPMSEPVGGAHDGPGDATGVEGPLGGGGQAGRATERHRRGRARTHPQDVPACQPAVGEVPSCVHRVGNPCGGAAVARSGRYIPSKPAPGRLQSDLLASKPAGRAPPRPAQVLARL